MVAPRTRRIVDQRTRDLAAIHAGKKQLGLDDETYRALLERVTGERSAADLTAKQRRDVVADLQRLGAGKPPPRATQGRPKNLATEPMLTKIEALLATMKLSWAYADSIAKRQTGIARVAWLRKEEHLRAVIAALHVEQEKRAADDELDRLIDVLHVTDKELAELTGRPRDKWRRNRDLVGKVIELLQARELLLQTGTIYP